MKTHFIPREEFARIWDSKMPKFTKLALIAKMCRLNTFFEVKKAGSGHLGSSFSAMDIVIYLFYEYFNILKVGLKNPNRDIYFSSKGHDVPGFYAVMYSLGVIPENKFLKLRKLGGLDGHPDIKIPGVEANSGSLGMGISKAKGMAFAKKILKYKGKIIILTGDGEFQEGQNFEALQNTVQQKINNFIVIMDHNKIQTDRPLKKIVDLGNLKQKFRAFGWHVERCNGHDFRQIERTLKKLEKIKNKPKIIIADTIKGKGISFMEHPRALKDNNGYYKFHSGAPADDLYFKGHGELLKEIKKSFAKNHLSDLKLKSCELPIRGTLKATAEFVAAGFGQAVVKTGKRNKKLVVLDADLSADCKIIDFERTYPDRFVECGIAEQDMVSTAGGLALQGLIPVVNSFGCFLASRPNEQIYNNLTENKKIIYVNHYAGLIPAGPGKSHQSLRDISLFSVFPNCTILQACNPKEMKMITRYAVNQAKESCMLRINIGPSPRRIDLPKDYKLQFGKGVTLTKGSKNILMAYGPTMLNEALKAFEILNEQKIDLKVINMPWLNRFDLLWLKKELNKCENLFILEDHHPFGGLADNLIDFFNRHNLLDKFKISKFAVEGYPACGTPPEVLKYHKLDGESLAKRISLLTNKAL